MGIPSLIAAFRSATGVGLHYLQSGNMWLPAAGVLIERRSASRCPAILEREACLDLLLQSAVRAGNAGEAGSYRCPGGLIRCMAPLFVKGQHVGSLLAGPVVEDRLDTRNREAWRTGRFHCLLERDLDGPGPPCRPIEVTAERREGIERLLGILAADRGDPQFGNSLYHESALIRKVKAILAERRDGLPSLGVLSRKVGVSRCHFCRLFKRQTGMCLTKYRLSQQIERAKALLLNSHLRVTEVALQTGFQSVPYFNRVFRRQVHSSPTEFRRRMQIQDKKMQTQA